MGNRHSNISTAAQLLRRANRVVKTSQIYENPSVDIENNILPNEIKFLNAAVQIETELTCEELLQYCKSIELVKAPYYYLATWPPWIKKNIRFEPRPIDLDILYYNTAQIAIPYLTVPHPRISLRPFVLKPLLDILTSNPSIDSSIVPINVKETLKSLIKSDKVFNDCFQNLSKIFYFKKRDRMIDLSKGKYTIRTIFCTRNTTTDRGIYNNVDLKRENDHARVLNHV